MGSVEWLWHCPAGRLYWPDADRPNREPNLYPDRTRRAELDVQTSKTATVAHFARG
jgi:hypothetical protein